MRKQLPPVVHFTLSSNNAKTGPIPVSVTDERSCPPTCKLKGAGCYAETGPLGLHWKAVNSGDRGWPWDMFCAAVESLPPMQLWRHNQAGDLPHTDGRIDGVLLDQLCSANFGRRGFTYTHHDPDKGNNADLIAEANMRGFTINLSADTPEHADALADLGIGPVVTILPADQAANSKTPAGRTVVVCPATQREGVSCSTCQLCARQRDTIVGFPAHGQSKNRVTRMFFSPPISQRQPAEPVPA